MQAEPGRDDQRGAISGPTPDLDLIEYVVMTTAALSSTESVARALKELVESSQIRILDLVGVEVDDTGEYSVLEPESLSGLAGLRTVEGEVGGLLSEDDIALACGAMSPGTSALILVAEDRWAQSLADAVRTSGGRIVGGERIPHHRIEQLRRNWSRDEED